MVCVLHHYVCQQNWKSQLAGIFKLVCRRAVALIGTFDLRQEGIRYETLQFLKRFFQKCMS